MFIYNDATTRVNFRPSVDLQLMLSPLTDNTQQVRYWWCNEKEILINFPVFFSLSVGLFFLFSFLYAPFPIAFLFSFLFFNSFFCCVFLHFFPKFEPKLIVRRNSPKKTWKSKILLSFLPFLPTPSPRLTRNRSRRHGVAWKQWWDLPPASWLCRRTIPA